MTAIEKAIRDAVEKGGWYGGKWYDFYSFNYWKGHNLFQFNDDSEDYLTFNDIFCDPSFWQALGKAREWASPADHSGMSKVKTWLTEWHRFIDHLADGKDTESFFATLQPKSI